MEKRICVLPGDGIGREVTTEAVKLLEDVDGALVIALTSSTETWVAAR